LYLQIGRLKQETIQAIVDEMAKKGNRKNLYIRSQLDIKFNITNLRPYCINFLAGDAEWDSTSRKRKAIIYWRKPEEWATLISTWVRFLVPSVVKGNSGAKMIKACQLNPFMLAISPNTGI
jgi:hypothetical protein